MAKIQIKCEKLTPFGGVFHVMELFERHLSHIIDGALGKRSVSIGYDLLLSGKMTIFAHGYIFFCKTKITKRADTS